MAIFFVLLTQFINLTLFTLDFQVVRSRRLLPALPPGKTRFAKQSRVLRRLREVDDEPGWKIRVLLNGEFTGIELDPRVVLDYVRIVFRVEGAELDVLCVDGVRENRDSDFLLRHRYIGCMRNFFWDGRTVESIDRSDTKLATKSRNAEGQCQNLGPWVDTTESTRANEEDSLPTIDTIAYKKIECSQQRPSPKEAPKPERIFVNSQRTSSKEAEAPKPERPMDDPRPLDPPDLFGGPIDCEDSDAVDKDSFVHAILFVLAMTFCILIKFTHSCTSVPNCAIRLSSSY